MADSNMEEVAQKAINQMHEKNYELDKVDKIYEYAIVFKGKECIVR